MQTETLGLLGLTWEDWFSLAGGLAMLGWVILILAPRRWPWLNAIPAIGIPLLISLGYGVLVITEFGKAEGGGYSSLAEVSLLFSVPGVLLAGWIHYLAFDLLVGAWIAKEADLRGIQRWVQAPILVATFMLGPVGFLTFWIVKSLPFYRRGVA